MKTYNWLPAILTILALSAAPAWGQIDDFWQNEGEGNWTDAANWLDALNNMDQPIAGFDERGLINNGGVAFVDTEIQEFNGPGGIVLGQEDGDSGHVEVRNNGVLLVETPLNEFEGSGGIIVGAGGVGSLDVMPGGELTAAGLLQSGSNLQNSIALGGADAGTADVTVGSAEFNGSTEFFPNANFASSADPDVMNVVSDGAVTFGAGSANTWHIDGASAAQLAATGDAALGGALNADFGGGAPSPGSSWPLLEAASIGGAFDSIQSSASLPLGQSLFTTAAPSAGGQLLSLNLDEVLVLNVNRNTGVAEITQPGNNNIEIDGYSILSSQGSLIAGAWNSLSDQDALGGGWTESNPTANSLNELKPSGGGTIASNDSIPLGSVFNPLAGEFGFTGEDLTFEYTSPDGSTNTGIVNMSGIRFNNLLLQIDPSSGEGTLRNLSSTSVDIDGYIVTSSSASLNSGQWNSLEDQGGAGGDWLEFLNASDNQIGEFKATEATTLEPSDSLSLGNLFDTTGEQDVVFEYIVDGAIEASLGAVVYEAFPELTADFDGNNLVDGNDFLVWQRGNGIESGAEQSDGDANGDGAVNGLDLTEWEGQYGFAESQAAVAAVPEPTAWALACLAMCGVAAMRRRGRS